MSKNYASSIRILLSQVEGPVNLGFICRAMANCGFETLRFSGPLHGNEPDARRFAVHAKHNILASAQKAADFDALIEGSHCLIGFTPRDPFPDRRQLDFDQLPQAVDAAIQQGQTIGLLFGNEAHGLDNQRLTRCTHRVALPSDPGYASLNLAQAVLVVLWHLHRGLSGSPQISQDPDEPLAPSHMKQQLVQKLNTSLDAMNYLGEQDARMRRKEFELMFYSRDWSKREVQLLIGFFHKTAARYNALADPTDNQL